jgi:hypothetical protein
MFYGVWTGGLCVKYQHYTRMLEEVEKSVVKLCRKVARDQHTFYEVMSAIFIRDSTDTREHSKMHVFGEFFE